MLDSKFFISHEAETEPQVEMISVSHDAEMEPMVEEVYENRILSHLLNCSS